MAPFTGADLVGAAAFTMALSSAIILLGLLARARADILGSPAGWRLVTASMALFAVRGFGQLFDPPWGSGGQHLAGIAAAILLPAGLYLILRAAGDKEVASRALGP